MRNARRQSREAEPRRLISGGLLLLDDFGLNALDPTESRDVYELFLERHRAGPIIYPGSARRRTRYTTAAYTAHLPGTPLSV